MKATFWGPALIGTAALVVSGVIMGGLLTFERAPAEATVAREEKPVYVEVTAVQPADVPVCIEGYGQVQALRMVAITPEVSGRVAAVHPGLIVGGHIPQDAILFEIDPRPYQAQVADAGAQVKRQESMVRRLHAEERHLQADLKDLGRQAELAESAFSRAVKLHEEGVGSQAAVDQAEQALVTAKNERDRLARDLDLYPIRIGESESDLESARAHLTLAQVDLEHTKIAAPFTARVKTEHLEAGEVVTAGSQVLTLVDDSVLEITVPLNSRDARAWLKFDTQKTTPDTAWFGAVAPVTCTVLWTEGDPGHYWEGTLDRVASYDEDSRTLSVVVRISGAQRHSPGARFPLVEGMFCSVRIPGRDMEGVYPLPAHAVSFEDTVFVADGDRLKTVPVTVVRIEADRTYVSGGLQPGDRVILTRLVNPLEHSLLSVNEARAEPVE